MNRETLNKIVELAKLMDGNSSSVVKSRTDTHEFVGQRIAIYGPNFIWRGLCEEITETTITLCDVYQVKNCQHDQDTAEDVYFTNQQIFQRSAVCNFGPAKWS